MTSIPSTSKMIPIHHPHNPPTPTMIKTKIYFCKMGYISNNDVRAWAFKHHCEKELYKIGESHGTFPLDSVDRYCRYRRMLECIQCAIG